MGQKEIKMELKNDWTKFKNNKAYKNMRYNYNSAYKEINSHK